MKRLPVLCLTSVLLLPPTAVSAQHTISLLGGMNLTVIANEAPELYLVSFQRVTGVNLGIAASLMLSPPDVRQTLSAQLAGTYSQKGALLGEDGIGFRMDYLELALLADAKFPSIVDGLFIHFLIGPALGWLLSCHRDFPATDDRPAKSTPCEEGEFRERDHAIAAGSGLEFGFADRLRVTTSFLYTIGLGHIDVGDEDQDPALKNRVLTLRAGLSYPIG